MESRENHRYWSSRHVSLAILTSHDLSLYLIYAGRVRIARHSKSGQYAAIKIISKYPTGSQLIFEAGRIKHSVEREIVIMKLIDHPNIMRLYDVWETSTDLYLIMEYVEGGELFDYLCNQGRLPTSEALTYFQQIISAVHYCHRFNIAHRDLKPENLLLDPNKNIKLADFGLAAYGANDGMLETFCGSPHYAAPEVISGQVYNGSCSDTWSCGIILHALLTGRLPFHEDDGDALHKKIILAEFPMPDDIDPQAQDLLSKMLEKDVTKRISITDVLRHPFYTSQKCEGPDHIIPDLESISRPLRSLSSIDPSIFANLRALWPNTSDDEIIDCLKNDEKNWQKGIYHLLVEYRSKHLEDYGDEEAELKHRVYRRRKKSRRSAPLLQGMLECQSTGTGLGSSPSSLPPRAAPPTPRRASRGAGSSSMDSLSDSFIGARAPQIKFHSPSPSDSPAPSPTSPLSPIWAALNLPPLEVPELQDEKMQLFFHQIVDHLNAMQQLTSLSPNLMAAPDINVGSSFRVNGSVMPPRTPFGVGFDQQGIPQRRSVTEDKTMLIHDDLGLSLADTRGLGISNKREGTQPLVVQRSKRHNPEIPVTRGDNKENEDEGYFIVDRVAKRPSLRKNGLVLGDKKVQIVEPSTERGKLKKKRAIVAPISPVFSGRGSSFVLPSPASPKRTWFDSVLKLKTANYELVSVYDAQTSCSECRRLLTELGVHVIPENVGLGILKCRLEEVRDQGVTSIKAVRFRVEIHSVEQGTGYETVLRFVQEKGARSSFKAVFGGVQKVWMLDTPGTPASTASPRLINVGRFAEVY